MIHGRFLAAAWPIRPRALTADRVLLDLTETYGHRSEYRKFWLEWEREAMVSAYCAAARELLASPEHQVVHLADGYLLVARRAVGLGASSRRDLPSVHEARAALEERCRVWSALTGRGYGSGPPPALRSS